MEGIILLALVAWVISAFGNAAKRKAKQAGDTEASPAAQGGDAKRRGRPIRPVDVDLPGQTTVPIHWEGTPSMSSTEPESFVSQYQPMQREEAIFSEAGKASPRMQSRMQQRMSSDVETQAPVIPGLNLELDGDAMVKGVIFSEILNRKTARRPR